MTAPISVKDSIRLCRNITRRSTKHFYFGMLFLPKEKREAMFSIYAFMRKADDLADRGGSHPDPEPLKDWKKALDHVYNGGELTDPVLPAFRHAVQRFQVPKQYFEDLIRGMEMDLSISRYETFEDLYPYCYRVASIVGLTVLQVIGSDHPEAKSRAEALGIAFQLTNILRDVQEDASLGRVYLPQEDLRRFGYSEEEIKKGLYDDRFRALMQFEYERAEEFYKKGRPLIPMLDPSGRTAIAILAHTYRGLLQKLHRRRFDVLRAPIHLSLFEKLALVAVGWTKGADA